jgi:ABC-type sugar transport system substrate-binding protein
MRLRGVSPLFWAAVVLAVVVVLAVAGCGGGGSSSSSETTTETEAETSPSEETSPEGEEEGEEGSTSNSSFNLAEWEKKTGEYEQGPTEYFGPTEPVKVPAGKKLAVISCSAVIRGCVRPVEAAGEIAEEFGWKVTTFDGKGTPQGNNAAIEEAVAGGAEVILTGGINPHFIASGLKAAREKEVLVASMSQGAKPEANGFPFDIGANYVELGEMIGSYVISDSGGKAVYQPFDDKTYESTVQFVESSERTVEEHCPECEVLPTQFFVGTQIESTLGPRVVSLLRSNPKINYLMGSYDPAATGMVPAIAAAGLKEQVKVVAGLGNEQNLQYVKEDNIQTADAGFDNQYMGYMAIYQVARTLNGEELWKTPGVTAPEYMYSGKVPEKLFTTNNTEFETGDYVADETSHYIAEFEKVLEK